jgi:hypothetical protein
MRKREVSTYGVRRGGLGTVVDSMIAMLVLRRVTGYIVIAHVNIL